MSDGEDYPKLNRARRHFLGLGAAAGARIAALGIAAAMLVPGRKASALGTPWWKKGGGGGSGGSGSMCFFRNTCIRTPDGEVLIENLEPGDMVLTASGEQRPIKWIGRQVFRPGNPARHQNIMPIRIRRHALEQNVPNKDLYVSPGHALFIDGALTRAMDLVNGTSIVPALPPGMETIEYYHILLDRHDVIVADGAPAETFLLNAANHENFTNFAEFSRRYPLDAHRDMQPYAATVGALSGRMHLKELMRMGRDCVLPDRKQPVGTWERIATRGRQLAG